MYVKPESVVYMGSRDLTDEVSDSSESQKSEL